MEKMSLKNISEIQLLPIMRSKGLILAFSSDSFSTK